MQRWFYVNGGEQRGRESPSQLSEECLKSSQFDFYPFYGTVMIIFHESVHSQASFRIFVDT